MYEKQGFRSNCTMGKINATTNFRGSRKKHTSGSITKKNKGQASISTIKNHLSRRGNPIFCGTQAQLQTNHHSYVHQAIYNATVLEYTWPEVFYPHQIHYSNTRDGMWKADMKQLGLTKKQHAVRAIKEEIDHPEETLQGIDSMLTPLNPSEPTVHLSTVEEVIGKNVTVVQ